MDMIGDRLLGGQPQRLAIIKLQVPAGEVVQLGSRILKQIEKGQQQRQMWARIRRTFQRIDLSWLRVGKVADHGVDVAIQEARPIAIRIALLVEVAQFFCILLRKTQKIGDLTLVYGHLTRIQRGLPATGLAGAIALDDRLSRRGRT